MPLSEEHSYRNAAKRFHSRWLNTHPHPLLGGESEGWVTLNCLEVSQISKPKNQEGSQTITHQKKNVQTQKTIFRLAKRLKSKLHNNPAELAARSMVQRRNISYGTQTAEGTKAWDTFMSLVATTRKLGLSFFKYVRDRIFRAGNIPSLATIIRDRGAWCQPYRCSINPFGWSW